MAKKTDTRQYIKIRGANEHNLKNIDVDIPRNELVVLTGLSGSGKSSLAFDTIYAEGQRRYMESLSSYARQFLGQMEKPNVESIEGLSPAISIDQKSTNRYAEGQRRYMESLSSYARQFLGQMEKPNVESIEGLSPAISIDQKSTNRNPRSTVGTVTEVYDYFRLLYARIGIPHCPKCGKEIKKQTVDQMVDQIMELPEGTKIQLLAPVVRGRKGRHEKLFERAKKSGYVRVRVDGNMYELTEEIPLDKNIKHNIEIVVDRLVVKPGIEKRLTDSVENVLNLAEGLLTVDVIGGDKNIKHNIEIVVDRLVVKPGIEKRLTDSVENVLNLAEGLLTVDVIGGEPINFSQSFSCPDCGISIEEIEPRSFSFNNPFGACPECYGLGYKMEFDIDLMIPDPSLSISQGAITVMGWQSCTDKGSFTRAILEALCKEYHFSLDTPFEEYPKEIKDILIHGTNGKEVKVHYVGQRGEGFYDVAFEGLIKNVERRYRETSSETMKAEYETFMRITPCHACGGQRLKKSALAVTVGDKNIAEVTALSIEKLQEFLNGLELTKTQELIGGQILKEIKARIGFLMDVGLDYLTLARATGSLSGGEAQRIRLATQIGSGLVGVAYILDEPSIGLHQRDNDKLLKTLKHLRGGEAQRIRLATQIGSGLVGVAYILDEPSIGLHQRDNDKLLKTLKHLRDLGNTLIVVEHDEDTMLEADYIVDIGPEAGEHGGEVVAVGTAKEIMKNKRSITIVVEHDEDTMLEADYIVDIGPEAGEHGGEVVAVGTAKEIMKNKRSITGAYLSGRIKIPVPEVRKKPTGWLKVVGAAENNLKNIDVEIPLGVMTCVTGVSGSGKSSLINEILYKRLARELNHARTIPGKHKRIEGIEQLDKVIDIDQSPIGRTPRSNPATYTGVFDLIRDLFAATPDAKARGYKKGRFSFNVKGGRCEACSGDGILKIEMHFLPDVYVPCEVCEGKRYNRETLEVKYKGKSIYDVLNMTVEEAMHFFENVPSIRRKMETLYDVGLSYIRLGQPSTTLSGGEAQRIKLATELSKRSTGKTVYILDEPTTGLHFADVHKLTEILQRLASDGNTVIVIEHNLDVIKTADYIIDIGPEGGDKGGTVVAKGTPEEIAANPKSYTGKYINTMLKKI